MSNQNPEQIARDKIDSQLIGCGWIIQDKKKFNDLDFDVSQISRIERGEINTSLLNLKKISASLEVNISILFEFNNADIS